MIDLLEVCKRATLGPPLDEEEFDRQVFFPKIKALTQKYDLRADPANPVNTDDAVADAIFEAALDLVTETGVYCQDTHRLIEFSRQEVLEAVKNAPGPCWFGQGLDRGLYPVRKPDDSEVPSWCHVGGSLPCSTEDIAFKVVEGIARIPEANSVTMPSLMSFRDLVTTAGSPQSFLACVRANEIGRAACRQAGRPGLAFLNGIPGAATALETIAASAPGLGLRSTDGWYVGFTAEMKIDYGALMKCAFLQSLDGRIGSQGAPIIGGYCGGYEGAAITNCAYAIAGLLVMKGRYHLTFPLDMMLGCTTTRGVLWTTSASAQAISRNINYPFHFCGYTVGGPMTASYFYETAAHLLACIPSGASTQTCQPAKACVTDHETPMEFQYAAEIIACAHKLDRAQANEIVKKVLPLYEGELATVGPGKSYQELFNLDTGYARQAYVDFYRKMKNELNGLGVPFSR